MEFSHKPVLLDECIENLNIKPDGLYVDCTVGGAGHSKEIAKRLTTGHLVGIDRDPEAVAVATERLAGMNATVVNRNYSEMDCILSELGYDKADGILMDLGVSSYQIDNEERGFSYNHDSKLDMRMNQTTGMSAADFLNTADETVIAKVLFEYGEEKFARKIAQAVVRARNEKKIETTFEFKDIICNAVPAKYRREKNPCKKSFQAVRIEVNGEFEHLKLGLEEAFKSLAVNGRLCVITFHSLEDRIVKNQFAKWSQGCICPPEFPVCVCGRKPLGKVISKKGIVASDDELTENKRSHSAKLRVIERTDEVYREN